MWQVTLCLLYFSLMFIQLLSHDLCQDTKSIIRCQFNMAKIPLAAYTVSAHSSLTETKCVQRMLTFKWDIGLYCPSSHFCGMGIDLNKTYNFEKVSDEFRYLQEVCHLLVNKQLTDCEEMKANLFAAGILNKSSWSCQSHGAVYCADKFLTLCMDAEGGAMCTGCIQGAQPEKEGKETLCIDRNECNSPPEQACGVNGTCVNEHLSYNCECIQGFQFDGKYGSQCTDINECDDHDYCGSGGVCNNTIGGYECHCHDGFYLNHTNNGPTCEDIDECLSSPGFCGENGQCISDKNGQLDCNCDEGFLYNSKEYGSGCKKWYHFWDHVLSGISYQNNGDHFNDVGNNNNLSSWNDPSSVDHDLFYDKIIAANQIALIVFDQSDQAIATVIFRAANDPLNWFQEENIISSSLWDISPQTTNLKLRFNGTALEISDTSDSIDKKFLKINCRGGFNCIIEYSPSNEAKMATNLHKANRFEVYIKPRVDFERYAELQLQYSIESSIGNIQNFFSGSETEDYKSPSTFRAKDFEEKLLNAIRIRVKIYRNEFVYKWLLFELQNTSFDSESWFSTENLKSYLNFFLVSNITLKYTDSTNGFLSILAINNSGPNPCAGEFFWFKIICQTSSTNQNCGFDWSRAGGSKCTILNSNYGTSWANRNYQLFKMIEVYTVPMTKAFSISFPLYYSDRQIQKFYMHGYRNKSSDLDQNLAFRHYKLEKLFTMCNFAKFRIYHKDSGQNTFGEVEYVDQEFIFKCGKNFTDWFTARNLVKTSFKGDLSDHNLVVILFENNFLGPSFLIGERSLRTWNESCMPEGVIVAQTRRTFDDEEQITTYTYCRQWSSSLPPKMISASKIEILVDYSGGDFYESHNKQWQLVFMVEAFCGIHIYNFFKNGSTQPAVPARSIVQNGGQFFRHPELESRIMSTSHIRFSVYNLDKSNVVNDIIFGKESGGGGLEDWFHWDHVQDSSKWELSKSYKSDGNRFFDIRMNKSWYSTHLQRFFYINNNWGGCNVDAGWFVAITKTSEGAEPDCGKEWANWWNHSMLMNESLSNQPPAFFYSYSDQPMKNTEMKLGGKITIEILN